ncbi:MAG: hypothetical protein P8123_09180, partial [bacterium]
NRINSLQKELERTQQRLSRLYDVKFDGGTDDEALNAKESEYKANIAEIKAIMNGLLKENPKWHENASRTLELANCLPSLYDRANDQEKAGILKCLASNYTIVDVTITPTWRKPFDLMAKGLSRTNWLPGQDSNLRHGGYR